MTDTPQRPQPPVIDVAAQISRRERRRPGRVAHSEETRKPDYRQLRNPFRPQTVLGDDEVAAIHDTALRVLEELGMLVLLPEARAIFARHGALVDEVAGLRPGRALDASPRSRRC